MDQTLKRIFIYVNSEKDTENHKKTEIKANTFEQSICSINALHHWLCSHVLKSPATRWPVCRLPGMNWSRWFCLCQSTLRRVLVVSDFFHFATNEAAVVLGTLRALGMVLFPCWDVCLFKKNVVEAYRKLFGQHVLVFYFSNVQTLHTKHEFT